MAWRRTFGAAETDEINTVKHSFELVFEHTSAKLELAETAVYSKQPAKEAMACHDHNAIGWTYSPP